jgi:hypothetical protein
LPDAVVPIRKHSGPCSQGARAAGGSISGIKGARTGALPGGERAWPPILACARDAALGA